MLKKDITFFGVFSIAAGAMISSGIFILPGMAFDIAGPAVFISYLLAGLLGLTGILSVVELSTAMPKSGGAYFYVNKTFGPLLGTITGFLAWAAILLKSAFAIYGISEVVYSSTGISHITSGLVFTLVFIFLNIVGVKKATAFQSTLVISLLSLLLIYIAFGIPEIETSRFTPFLDNGVNQIFVGTAFVFVTFGGLIQVANVSEEVINPKRNMPLGIISSVLAVSIVYTLVTYVITGTLAPEEFRDSLSPVADSAELFMGTTGYIIITVASLIAFISTANAGIMAAARYPMALSRDKLLPRKLSLVSKKFNTPVLAIIITGTVIFLSLTLPLETLVKAASSVILATYVLTNLAVIILRESKVVNYKPTFKTPLYPWIQIFSLIVFTFLIIDLGVEAIELIIGLLIISVGFYLFYGRKMQKKEYALLHLLERVSARELTENILEDELREIIIDREDIEQDFFDDLIKDAEITDIEGPETIEKVIENVVTKISDQTEMKEDELLSRFLTKRKESNICITDFCAIHHIVIEGKNKMFLKIIRSKEGIKFTDNKNRVKAVFLVGGTKDKRIPQFETLNALAELLQKKKFKDNWLAIEDHVELKNLLTLNQRKRSS